MNLGHKGNLLYAENSQESILKTLSSPYNDGLELDVRMTKDHKLVIIHDWNTFLTGNKMRLVKHMTLEELGSVSCHIVLIGGSICFKPFLILHKTVIFRRS